MSRFQIYESKESGLAAEDHLVESLGPSAKFVDPWPGGKAIEEDSLQEKLRLGGLLYHDSSIVPIASCAPELVFWARISDGQEIVDCTSPLTFPEQGNKFTGLRQGRLANLWFLNALSILGASEHGRQALRSVVVSDRYAKSHGVYLLRFWKEGKWVYVMVDDRIPCDVSGTPLYARGCNMNQVWPMVIEKGFAKLHGSYLNLENGKTADALRDLTGGVTEYIPMDWYALEERVRESQTEGSSARYVLGARRSHSPANRPRSDGIVSGWMYTLIGMYEPRPGVKLVKLKDMWSLSIWKGKWSSMDPVSWAENVDVKEQLNPDDDWPKDELYMSWEDFQSIFTESVSCLLSCPDTNEAWRLTRFSGEFQKKSLFSNAGGSPNDEISFLTNPMIRLSLKDSCHVGVELRQDKDKRLHDYFLHETDRGFEMIEMDKNPDNSIDNDEAEPDDEKAETKEQKDGNARLMDRSGWMVLICKLGPFQSGKKRLQRLFNDDVVAHSGVNFRNERQVGCTKIRLEKGDYVVVPSTYSKNVFGKFILEIYTCDASNSQVDFFPDPGEITKALNEIPADEADNDDEDGDDQKKKPFPVCFQDKAPLEVDDFASRDYLEMAALQNMMSKFI